MQVQWIDPEGFPALGAAAETASRRRINRNFHDRADDPLQRMLNVLAVGSYVPPHRHKDKSETLLVLRGEAAAFLFDDDGGIVEARRLGGKRDPLGVDIAPGVWHCIAALSPVAVLFEVKPGPYDPASAKAFAPWAPAENDARAADFLNGLLKRLA